MSQADMLDMLRLGVVIVFMVLVAAAVIWLLDRM